jgi:lipoprotein NlpI
MWQFICVARAHGIDQARQATLKLGNDRLNERRELMKRVCDLYNGILKPADVVAAANAGKVDAQQRNIQLFYAHLYVGIYYDLTGDKNLAFEHVNAATGDEHRWHGQLWDIARVQRNVLAKDLKKIDALIARARLLESMDKFDEAVAEWSKVIELQLDKDSADSYQFRGLVRFKAGQIKESIADFDEYIKRVPKAKISHWQRGISYYYAAEYENGRKQFEGYQDFDSNDVENAVWRFMCMVRADGIDKARKTILKIGDDRRVPMRQVYDLYKGDLKPDDVLAAANAGKVGPSQRNSQLFYAHLYVGIYYDLVNDKKKAFDHVNKAAEEHRIGHYMWDVARIHRDMLSKELKKNRD